MREEYELAAIFKALGDPTRLRIFELLRCCDVDVEIDAAGGCHPAGSLSVGEVCCRFDQSLSTISRHLKELRLAGLVRMEKRGRSIYCSVDPRALALIHAFLDQPAPAAVPQPDPGHEPHATLPLRDPVLRPA